MKYLVDLFSNKANDARGLIIFCFLFAQIFASNVRWEEWNHQKKGANYFNKAPHKDWFKAASNLGVQFVRLAADKWIPERRDFLIGDADHFSEIPKGDLEKLIEALDQASQHQIKIVITLLSLPGSRWRQNNDNKDDLRLWQESRYQKQAILFWKNLADQLKGHPAVIGYNILNEPHPECLTGNKDFRSFGFSTWQKTIENSLSDLNAFYRNAVRAIREVDQATPIILDTGMFATPWAIEILRPLDDPYILYSFHMYEPYNYTTRKMNLGTYSYPGKIPSFLDTNHNEEIYWDKLAIESFLQPVLQWQNKNRIPSSQILVGEFGCDRTAIGAEMYLKDLIAIFNEQKWHWAFYSFREDCWDSMDYELGAGKLDWRYWEAYEKGLSLDPFRKNNFLFDCIREQFVQKDPF